jgi:hypothetical protein
MYDRKATVTSKKFDAYQVTFSHRLLVMYTFRRLLDLL